MFVKKIEETTNNKIYNRVYSLKKCPYYLNMLYCLTSCAHQTCVTDIQRAYTYNLYTRTHGIHHILSTFTKTFCILVYAFTAQSATV